MALMDKATQHLMDADIAQRCLEGDTEAIKFFEDNYLRWLENFLCARGARIHEARDIVASLWTECMVNPHAAAGKRPLFEHYNGQFSLRAWLSTLALNRFLSLKRHQHMCEIKEADLSAHESVTRAMPQSASEPHLTVLLRAALRSAMATCEPDAVVFMQLVHVHGIARRSIATIWRCHESTIGRKLESAEKHIRESVLANLKKSDPWLNLQWHDVEELCQNANCLHDLLAVI